MIDVGTEVFPKRDHATFLLYFLGLSIGRSPPLLIAAAVITWQGPNDHALRMLVALVRRVGHERRFALLRVARRLVIRANHYGRRRSPPGTVGDVGFVKAKGIDFADSWLP